MSNPVEQAAREVIKLWDACQHYPDTSREREALTEAIARLEHALTPNQPTKEQSK